MKNKEDRKQEGMEESKRTGNVKRKRNGTKMEMAKER